MFLKDVYYYSARPNHNMRLLINHSYFLKASSQNFSLLIFSKECGYDKNGSQQNQCCGNQQEIPGSFLLQKEVIQRTNIF